MKLNVCPTCGGVPRSRVELDQSYVTAREAQIIELLIAGKRNFEVAKLVGIDPNTVHSHLRNVMERLDLPDIPAVLEKYSSVRAETPCSEG